MVFGLTSPFKEERSAKKVGSDATLAGETVKTFKFSPFKEERSAKKVGSDATLAGETVKTFKFSHK